jgi:hypothetical protein
MIPPDPLPILGYQEWGDPNSVNHGSDSFGLSQVGLCLPQSKELLGSISEDAELNKT